MNDTAQSTAAGATAALAARVSAISSESLDAGVIAVTQRLIADGIAVAIAGTHEAAPQIAAEHVHAMGCSEHASVWGFGFKTTAQHAAYLNAISMHVLDFEPMSNP